MPTPAEIERALRVAGERRATDGVGGFVVEGRADTVEVRWSVPPAGDAPGGQLHALEFCARVLREAGIRATLVADAHEPRVVCLPRRRAGRPSTRRRAT